MSLALPQGAREVLARLTRAGYEAYLVGGAVRDLLLSRAVSDIDVATSARPDEVRALFSPLRVVETGIAHGTVTVLLENGEKAEITTFRKEGAYSDFRHPDRVEFVDDVFSDLARRDFTVGAMALSLEGQLLDPYGGREDLAAGVLRAVGEAERRFSEDALRILRGLRFVATLGFSLEKTTRRAMHKMKDRLSLVARERQFSELCRLLCGEFAERVLFGEREILAVVLPELLPTFDFEQKSPYHAWDVYTHTGKTVCALPRESALRLAALYHDLGKPQAFFTDEKGVGHFYGHAEHSTRIAVRSLRDFAAPRLLAHEVAALVALHDDVLTPTKKCVRRRLYRHGEAFLVRLITFQRADASAHGSALAEEKLRELDAFERLLSEVLCEEKERGGGALALSGEDLLALGIPESPALGRILQLLREAVLEEEVANTREALLPRALSEWELMKGD
ncbi:MAG: HD domain-containing protein [Clostridia bacterium]|nr:HD domain-containing protein [Clostridia bacterium]